VGFHGYAQNAETFLESLVAIPGAETWRVASVQGLHPFYSRGSHVVAGWMTRQDREHAIADNIAYVDAVLDDMAAAFGAPEKLVFAGFSQGVAMAYRAAMRGARPGARDCRCRWRPATRARGQCRARVANRVDRDRRPRYLLHPRAARARCRDARGPGRRRA